jgi:hypothetical protein
MRRHVTFGACIFTVTMIEVYISLHVVFAISPHVVFSSSRRGVFRISHFAKVQKKVGFCNSFPLLYEGWKC